MTRKKQNTKKCPTCKGTGRVKVDSEGFTKEENKILKEKYKDMAF